VNERRTMHLFAGVGGGLLADLILGHTPVVAVEWDRYACQVLRERAADGWFPKLSVWEGDVRMFDPSEYTGGVDIIHAGFPCQDISVAGKQAGVSEGTRSGLYREVLRIAGVVRPRCIFLENVSAILCNGLGTVLGDLASLGYDTRWMCIRASDVGAPHHRDRWFALAHSKHAGQSSGSGGHRGKEQNTRGEEESRGLIKFAGSNTQQTLSGALPNANGINGWSEPQQSASGSRETWIESERCSSDVSHTMFSGLEGQRKVTSGTGEKYKDPGNPCWWEVEPELGRVADGIPNRVGQLKGYGNAQVPLQAAAAYRLLGGI